MLEALPGSIRRERGIALAYDLSPVLRPYKEEPNVAKTMIKLFMVVARPTVQRQESKPFTRDQLMSLRM